MGFRSKIDAHGGDSNQLGLVVTKLGYDPHVLKILYNNV